MVGHEILRMGCVMVGVGCRWIMKSTGWGSEACGMDWGGMGHEIYSVDVMSIS